MTARDMNIRRMTRDELDTLVEWAACEGWNPGLDDAEVFWATDPEGFIAAEIEGELIGGGSIVAYEKKYGFIGLFIVRPEYRGHEVPPRAGGFLGLAEKFSILMTGQLLPKRFQCDASVSDESHIDRIPQPDSRRIDIDLHCFRLSWFRHEFDIRERRPGEEESIALFERVLRGTGAE